MTMRVIEDDQSFRKNIANVLAKFIHTDKLSINLEKGIYNYSLKEASNLREIKKWNNPYFVQIYVNRFKSIMHNLEENPKLVDEMNSGTLKPEVLAFMTYQEMVPEKWDVLIDRKIKRDKSKYETRLAAATDTFTCRKCKSKECNYYQMQTRSADEPMTTFVSCINCGSRWKC
jgi:transcription elongation factor S-II